MHDERLKRCPFCGGPCKTIQGTADNAVWAHGKFWRAYCVRCQSRQLFHRSEVAAIGAWNHRMPDQQEPKP